MNKQDKNAGPTLRQPVVTEAEYTQKQGETEDKWNPNLQSEFKKITQNSLWSDLTLIYTYIYIYIYICMYTTKCID